MRKLWITLPILFFGYVGDVEANIDEEVLCLAENIYWEARSESTAGKVAVGLVTLNRVKDDRFPDTICGVVKQTKYYPSGRIDLHSCQFSWYCDGKPDIPTEDCWKDILVLAAILYGWQTKEDITKGALWYHSKKVSPNWAPSYMKTVSIDNHIFYKPID
tara:strand:+ start:1285 stop:1764 length:480 start_codon:yes stop_codon:yes gene_type:complete